jgi:uncharacterized alpha-E superfamily protein
MLSRTANELYWMARYQERAETLARLLDVTNKLSLMPVTDSERNDLMVPLNMTGTCDQYFAAYNTLSMHHLVQFMTLDNNNFSSIYHCLQMAWNNAHAVRGRLSSEVWECINATWIEMKSIKKRGLSAAEMDAFFDWTKERSHVFRGAISGTLMRDDAMAFIQLGTLIERADSTARLLDAKTELLNADSDPAQEYFRMDMLLRAVSAREAYHSIYRHPPSHETIIELLILRKELPRSLRSCMNAIVMQLDLIENAHTSRPRKLVESLHQELAYTQLSDVKGSGLTPWLASFIQQVHAISNSIHQTYLEA